MVNNIHYWEKYAFQKYDNTQIMNFSKYQTLINIRTPDIQLPNTNSLCSVARRAKEHYKIRPLEFPANFRFNKALLYHLTFGSNKSYQKSSKDMNFFI